LDGEFLANQPMTFPRIFPVVAPSFFGNGARGGALVAKNGFFGSATGCAHTCFEANLGCGCCGIDPGGAFGGTGFGGVPDPEFWGTELSSESSCSKKSDIIKG